MAGRVSLITGAVAVLALAACAGPAATPTPAPAVTPAATAGVSATPASSSPAATVAPGGSSAATGTTAPTAGASDALSAGLEGIEWNLVSISDGSLLNPIPSGISVTMTLKNGIAAGSSGCNTYTTPYTLDLQEIIFGDVASTTKACDDGAMLIESNYVAALEAVARFGGQQAGLILFAPSGAPVLLYLAAPTGTLAGDWDVTAYQNDQGAIVPPVAGTPVTVSFKDDGTLSGSDGCNSFTGTYTKDGPRLTVSGLSGTRVACPSQELTDQEAPFLTALEDSTLWTASQTALVLRGANGIVTLTLDRAAD